MTGPDNVSRNKRHLSADALFHFTPTRENLLGILKDDFLPRYSVEDWDVLSGSGSALDPEVAIPMVCFCDIPLSQLANHISVYGRYALGMTKEWAIANGISPVLYTHGDASTSWALKKARNSYHGLDMSEIDPNAFYPLVDFLCYCKPYEGPLRRDDETVENVRFYDEREWRYFPSEAMREERNAGNPDLKILLYQSQYRPKGKIRRSVLEAANDDVARFSLSFTPDDIKYVIIDNEQERLDMARELAGIKGKYPWESVQVLMTKIMLTEQILADC